MVGLFIIVGLTSAVFFHTVEIRRPWFGSIVSELHINLTAHTLLFAKNWYRNGALSVKFASVSMPRSIEYPGADNWLYVSWPPGYILPVYLISRFAGCEPSVEIVQAYNLACHFITALFLAATVLIVIDKLDYPLYCVLFLTPIPIFIILLSPGNLWYQQMVYMSQQAVIPLFAVFLFLEAMHDYVTSKTFVLVVDIVQACVFLFGILTAYIFIFIGMITFIKRIASGEIEMKPRKFIRYSLLFWAPAIIGLFLIAVHITLLDRWPVLLARARLRLGASGGVDFLLSRFWNMHMPMCYGHAGNILVWTSSLLLLMLIIREIFWPQPRTKKLVCLASISLIPCYLQIYIMKNHTWHHGYTALKFSLPLALLPFVFLPFILFEAFRSFLIGIASRLSALVDFNADRIRTFISFTVCLSLFAISFSYVINEYSHRNRLFKEESKLSNSMPRTMPFRLVGRNTSFNDIVFSPNVVVTASSKASLAYTMKIIHPTYTIFDILLLLHAVGSECNVTLLINDEYPVPEFLGKFVMRAKCIATAGSWRILTMKKRLFTGLYQAENDSARLDAYRKEKLGFERNLKKCMMFISRNMLTDADKAISEVISFIDRHNVSMWNLYFFRLELAILKRLKKREKAGRLSRRIDTTTDCSSNIWMWGWSPYPWMIDCLGER